MTDIAAPTEAPDEATAGDDEPTLVISEGWVLHGAAEARLRHLLDQADPTVAAIAAAPAPLEPGESYVAHAERAALEPLGPLTATPPPGPFEGAALVRAGVRPSVIDGAGIVVPVRGARVVVDTGAHVHDPWAPVVPLGRATTVARSPFPRRPVALLVACEHDLDVADWARALANDLVRRGIDARLALPLAPEGLYLTRPCRPEPDLIEVLAPQVVIPADDAAREAVDDWWGDDRNALVIDHVPDMTLGVELVSWQLGRAQGRLRARVGAVTNAAELAPVIDRLCGGPQPLPPSIRPEPVSLHLGEGGSTTRTPARTRPTPRDLVVLGRRDDADPYVRGLLDRVDAAGGRLEWRDQTQVDDATLIDADVLVLTTSTTNAALDGALLGRQRVGRASVVVLRADDFEGDGDDGWTLRPDAERLLEAAGLAVVPSRPAADAIRSTGVRQITLPLLLDRAFAGELRSLRVERGPVVEGTLAWLLDDGTDGAVAASIAEAVGRLLVDHTDLQLVTVGAAELPPFPDGVADRVAALDERPGAWQVNRWTAQIWSTGEGTRLSGDLLPLLVANELGVPTLLPADHAALDVVPHPPPLVVRRRLEPDAWYDQLHPVVTELGPRLRRSAELSGPSEVLYGSATSALVADRFLGWLSHEEPTRG